MASTRRWALSAVTAMLLASCAGSATTEPGRADTGPPYLGDGPELTWSTGPARPVELDLTELPGGTAPTIPYVVVPDGGPFTYRHGDASIERISPGGYAGVAAGQLVMVTDQYEGVPELSPGRYLIQPDGSHRLAGDPDAEGAVGTVVHASADGRFAAWQYRTEGGAQDAGFGIGDGNSGELLATVEHGDLGPWEPQPGWWSSQLVGMLDQRILIHPSQVQGDGADEDLGASARIWDPDSGEVELLEGTAGATGTDGSTLAVVEWGKTAHRWDDGERYTSVLDTAAGNRELWHSLELGVRAFAPDGRHIAVRHDDSDRGFFGGQEIGILDTETQELVLVFDAGVHGVAWESPETVLLSVLETVGDTDAARSALVRCGLTGGCERATPAVDLELPGGADAAAYWEAPYQIR